MGASAYWKDRLIDHVTELGTAELDENYPARVANIIDGGQLGTGIQITRLDAATPLVFNPAVLVVTQTPGMWDNQPYAQKMLKSLVEVHAKEVTGLDVSYTLNTATTPVGWDGQEMKVPTNTTRSAVDPSFTWTEVTGNLVWNFIRKWIFDIQHPDTNASLMSATLDSNETMPPFLMSSFSMSMMAIQFDPTMLPENIIDGFYYTCMFPTGTGEFGLQRSWGQTQTKDRSIQFTGLVQHNDNTKWLAQEMASILQFHKVNYNKAIAGPGGDAKTIQNNYSGAGVNNELNRVINHFVDKALLDPDVTATANRV